ncbi:MAG: hypothetical protein AAB710_00930 [Patescibacteria group bacterium]
MNAYLKIILPVLFLCAATTVWGLEYNLLAPLPGGTGSINTTNGFITYGSQLFWFLLSATIILALVMMVIGGVEYVGAAGNTSFLGDAKDRIINALLGLVIALAAWLILNLINPELVNFQLNVPDLPSGHAAPLPTAASPSSTPTSINTYNIRTV